MRSGVVAGNNYRPLGRDEFRGFSISDGMAPLIFINAHDFKGTQIFTLAHELAHIWTGRGGHIQPGLRPPVQTAGGPGGGILPPRCRRDAGAGRGGRHTRAEEPGHIQRSPTCADTLMYAASTFIGCSGNGESLGTPDRVRMEWHFRRQGMVRVGSAAYEIRIGLSRGRTKEARPAGPQAWGRRGRPFTLHLWGEWYSWS